MSGNRTAAACAFGRKHPGGARQHEPGQRPRKNAGFTLHELLVVLVVGGLLVGFSYTFYSFVNRMFQARSVAVEFRSGVQGIVRAIAFEIEQSRTVLECTDSTLVLTKRSGNTVRYRFNGEGVWRNEESMLPRACTGARAAVRLVSPASGRNTADVYRVKVLAHSAQADYQAETMAAATLSSKELLIRGRQ